MADFFMADQLTSQVIINNIIARLHYSLGALKCKFLRAKLVHVPDSIVKTHVVCSVLLHGRKL